MSTETIVPETTPSASANDYRMLIGAVVRLKTAHLHLPAGTKGVVCAARDGRFGFEIVVPGCPLKFWVETREMEVLEAPQQDWWKLLESPDA